jgi:hypothetical protein
MTSAESIAKALGDRKAGGGWMARCRAHDDREPSLSIRDADEGKVWCNPIGNRRRNLLAHRISATGRQSAWVFRTELLRQYTEIEPRRLKGQGSGS